MSGGLRKSARDDRGSGSIFSLALGSAVMLIAATLLGVLALYAVRHAVITAADSAALAAAETVAGLAPGDPCGHAEALAQRAGATLAACTRGGADVTVTVERRIWGLKLRATARAGPERNTPEEDKNTPNHDG